MRSKIAKYLSVILCFILASCGGQTKKIDGVSFVASRDAIDAQHIQPVINLNANYASVMPFGFIRDLKHPELIFNTERQWFGERVEGVKQYIKVLQDHDIQVMLKPQIWVWRGEFTGQITMASEADWKTFEKSYSNFILTYAKLAEQLHVSLFCIGTELKNFTHERPQFWKDLISKIRVVYKGKLTYAANWNEYETVPFWSDLDYVGIDAYFPVSDKKMPSVEDCLAGWEKYKPEIKALSDQVKKSVLFTEYGYRSVDYTGKAPWVSDRNMKGVNVKAQYNATEALFKTFWNESWFSGGFLWKWFHDHDRVGGENNTMYTPQNKPVEALIKKQYSLNG
ncbi:glycoside hydrolase family 113 [Gaetbulibacter aestuarii]|uniref:Glycoside hydrolase TIM-barrel-like domain-containing protein n=1 Tax=Gaetbulibacter aestuarii TaxID=1502358 RepID=A0ABW7MZD5_9FLAO